MRKTGILVGLGWLLISTTADAQTVTATRDPARGIWHCQQSTECLVPTATGNIATDSYCGTPAKGSRTSRTIAGVPGDGASIFYIRVETFLQGVDPIGSHDTVQINVGWKSGNTGLDYLDVYEGPEKNGRLLSSTPFRARRGSTEGILFFPYFRRATEGLISLSFIIRGEDTSQTADCTSLQKARVDLTLAAADVQRNTAYYHRTYGTPYCGAPIFACSPPNGGGVEGAGWEEGGNSFYDIWHPGVNECWDTSYTEYSTYNGRNVRSNGYKAPTIESIGVESWGALSSSMGKSFVATVEVKAVEPTDVVEIWLIQFFGEYSWVNTSHNSKLLKRISGFSGPTTVTASHTYGDHYCVSPVCDTRASNNAMLRAVIYDGIKAGGDIYDTVHTDSLGCPPSTQTYDVDDLLFRLNH